MLEIEMKFHVDDPNAIERALLKAGATSVGAQSEADHYYAAPDRDFARTDEALRLRRIGEKNVLTYKGPKLDAQTKTRKEIEVALTDGTESAERMLALLESLRYRPVAVVRKQRRPFELVRDRFTLHATIDEVDSVGTFVELEIVAPEQSLEPARQIVQEAALQLGLNRGERRSYLEMLLEREQSPS